MNLKSFRKFGVLIILAVLCTVFVIINPVFFSIQNLVNIMRQVSIMSILSVGMTLVLLSGGIDLSMGAVMSLLCVVIGKLICEAGLPVWISCIIGIAIATLIGFLNGIVISKIKVPPLIFTLGMSTTVSGVAFMLCNGLPVYGIPDEMKWIGQAYLFDAIPIPVVIMVVILLLGIFLLRKTYLGRYFYAIGSNEEATKLAGLNTDKIRTIIYTITGFLVGIAGIIMLGRIGSGQPNAGTGYEMDVLTACVLGGVSLTGGKGSVLNAFVGVLIIGVLSTGMSLAGTSEFLQMVVKGLVLMAAVTLDCSQYIKRRKKVKKEASDTI